MDFYEHSEPGGVSSCPPALIPRGKADLSARFGRLNAHNPPATLSANKMSRCLLCVVGSTAALMHSSLVVEIPARFLVADPWYVFLAASTYFTFDKLHPDASDATQLRRV